MTRSTPHPPMDDATLARRAQQEARSLRPEGSVSARRLATALGRDLRTVREAHAFLTQWAEGRQTLPPAVEWILDNYYLALREGQEAAEALRRGKKLRRCDGTGSLLSACADWAVEWVPDLNRRRLGMFLEGFQSAHSLTERELSLLVPALAGALLGRLAELCLAREALCAGQVPARELEEVFGGLRALKSADWAAFLEEASLLESILRQDPSGHYPGMEEGTRRRYRQQLCRLARREGLEEQQVARRILELASAASGARAHMGWYLFRAPLGREKPTSNGRWYGLCILCVTFLVAAAVGMMLSSASVALLLLFPLSDLVKNCFDFLVVRLVPPRPVHRMELEEGIPPEGRTLCVVVCLLTGPDSGKELAALLERYRLANRDSGPELRLGILADVPDRAAPMGPQERAWAEEARQAVEGLNQAHGGGFYLFFRTPSFHPRDERYQGWERKRGALLELTALLRGRETGLKVLAGDQKALKDTKYVVTLDGDTCLSVGAARELVGAMLHPLSRPEIDPARRVVVSGYGLLQPRISVELTAANRSLFSRIYGGQGGVDPYGSTASDVYHDLFDQGTYTGKGIFDVDAFEACLAGRFPEGRILSHDLLEGCYLHAGLLGEVELTDGYPYKVAAYFSRLHRWVRGDWQVLPWLLPRVPKEGGGREHNPLTPLSRWKIFDNLRRALSPVFTLLALMLGICVSNRVFAAAGTAAVLAAASNLLLSGVELAARRGAGSHVRYHSTIIAGLAGVILQTLIQLLFLPYHAYVCAHATLTALWRMGVSRRNLLSWVTAAQAEAGKGSLWVYLKGEWFALAAGLVTFFCADLRFGALVGIVWACSPVLAWAISRPVRQGRQVKRTLSRSDRAFLLHQGTLIWGFFRDFLRPEDHYLPPDNYQEQPSVGLARRTSPTNIGMAMLSVMAAADLDFLPKERAAQLLEHMVETTERLPKWQGHLYNWYDTAAAAPLVPRYVSTVDSGNLCGCLIALAAGLREWGKDDLAARCDALAVAMEFKPLYDPVRKLFSIGYEVEENRMTEGWYDLLASEARQTSYLAVARGEVEPRHWRRLGRMLLGDNDYRGMASWTGTMFEYFMPNLLLSCEENSLIYESLAFCVYAQKRQGARRKAPWGVSESGFYAFDPGMSYQYKAHGVQTLGLKRGLDREYVAAPYAAFLALLLAPRSAVRNLRRLRDMGLEGKYGLYEAADFTPSRLTGSAPFETVRSYMAHHLGMSLVAVDNALNGNVMQRRFMGDSSMAAFRQLLQERVPVGAPVMRNTAREIPEKPARYQGPALLRRGEGCHPLSPHCQLLAGESYTLLAWDSGLTQSKAGERDVTLARPGQDYAPAGLSFFFAGKSGVTGLTAAPLYTPDTRYRWQFTGTQAVWEMERGDLAARITASVPPSGMGEVRHLRLEGKGKAPLDGALYFYLEPVLCPRRDYDAHPAFSKLFLESRPFPGGVAFLRRGRSGEVPVFLAVCWDGEGGTFTTRREHALGRGGLRALAAHAPPVLDGQTGAHPDPCLLVRIPVSLSPGARQELHLALAVGGSLPEAVREARRLLEGKPRENHRIPALAQRLGLEERRALEAFRLLEAMEAAALEERQRPPQRALWPLGISGDYPIVLAGAAGEEGLENAELWCAQHQFLARGGYPFDLVLLVEEGGDYRRPVRTALADRLKELGAESALGAKGGIHLVMGEKENEALAQWAAVRLPLESRPPRKLLPPPPPVRLEPEPAPWRYDGEGNVVLQTGTRLPPAGWSQVLCNDAFGWITDETGCGFLWQDNAREGRLTPWPNDPLSVSGPERFLFRPEGQEAEHSAFADGDGLPCTVTYGPGFAKWEKKLGACTLETTAFVPQNRPCRVLRFQTMGGGGTLLRRRDRDGEEQYPLTPEAPLVLLTEREGNGVRTFAPGEAYAPRTALEELENTRKAWRETLGALEVQTPHEGLNHALNTWYLYQTLACRVLARTSQYQNGGAYGFRDQLQDVCALLYTAPGLAREHLIRAAGRQFREGDVQHWWHPPEGAGVRTRITDDLLWLPYALALYVARTGDWEVCKESAPYLFSQPLKEGEHERYETPGLSGEEDTLYRHACRAITCFLERGTGEHGLPFMGAGDWNDGMNRVGAAGRGQSVWLAWFGAMVLERFVPLCRHFGEAGRAEELERQAKALTRAAQDAWDGGWYRRGYYDDGTPLGAQGAEACAIDSIAQSFSAFVSNCDRERANTALTAALDRLFDQRAGLVRLFDPPFAGAGGGRDPGYLAAYHPGMRENGGQYTHGAVWLAVACLRLGRVEEGFQLLEALLPCEKDPAVYRVEPYVLAADVYAAPGHVGRGGWSWYTGAAGWYYRAAVEDLLGLSLAWGTVRVTPRLPAHWPGYTARWALPGGTLHICVKRTGTPRRALDGADCPEELSLEALAGEHRLEVEL